MPLSQAYLYISKFPVLSLSLSLILNGVAIHQLEYKAVFFGNPRYRGTKTYQSLRASSLRADSGIVRLSWIDEINVGGGCVIVLLISGKWKNVFAIM